MPLLKTEGTMFYKNKKRLQIINYIFKKLDDSEGLSKEFIGKLIYLANKLFLLKYGSTITGDKFVAFERGTTCSETLAIMDMNTKHVDEEDMQAIKTFKSVYDVAKRPSSKKVHTIFVKYKLLDNFSTLSEVEREILDIILNKFGGMTESNLSKYTHEFLEWQNYDKKLKEDKDTCATLNMEDVFNDNTFFEDKDLSQHLNKDNLKIAYSVYHGDY